MPIVGEISKQDVTIANAAQVSTPFRAAGYRQGSVQVGAAVTSANFTVQVTNEDTPSNWTDLQDDAGVAVAAVPCTANESCPLPARAFQYLWARIKTASNEGAARTWRVVLAG
jgi:hypothetical protein